MYTPDVSDSTAMQAMAPDWMARSGAVPDLVIANAGVAGGFDTAEADDLAVLRRMLEVNLLGAATTFQPFVKAMRAQRRGALVGVASIAGWRGMPGNGAYCASKGGLIRYLESLRAELRGESIVVSTVSPGYLRTALTAGNRFAMPGLMEPEAAALAGPDQTKPCPMPPHGGPDPPPGQGYLAWPPPGLLAGVGCPDIGVRQRLRLSPHGGQKPAFGPTHAGKHWNQKPDIGGAT